MCDAKNQCDKEGEQQAKTPRTTNKTGRPSNRELELKKALSEKDAKLDRLEKQVADLIASMSSRQTTEGTPVTTPSSAATPSAAVSGVGSSGSVTSTLGHSRYQQLLAFHEQMSAQDELAKKNKEILLLRAAYVNKE